MDIARIISLTSTRYFFSALFAVPTFLRGPRTIDFYNNLYFNKIQIGLVRGLLSKGTNPIPVTIDEIAVLSP